MQIEEKFNVKSAKLIECVRPIVRTACTDTGNKVQCEFFTAAAFEVDARSLAMQMTPIEAANFANALLSTALILIEKENRKNSR